MGQPLPGIWWRPQPPAFGSRAALASATSSRCRSRPLDPREGQGQLAAALLAAAASAHIAVTAFELQPMHLIHSTAVCPRPRPRRTLGSARPSCTSRRASTSWDLPRQSTVTLSLLKTEPSGSSSPAPTSTGLAPPRRPLTPATESLGLQKVLHQSTSLIWCCRRTGLGWRDGGATCYEIGSLLQPWRGRSALKGPIATRP